MKFLAVNSDGIPTYEIDSIQQIWESLRFKKIAAGPRASIYYAEREDGLCRFFYHDPRNQTGFGGAAFDLRMKDESLKTILGPWSSSGKDIGKYFHKKLIEINLIEEGWITPYGLYYWNLEKFTVPDGYEVVEDFYRYYLKRRDK